MKYLIYILRIYSISILMGASVTFDIDMNGSGYPNSQYDQCGVNGSWNNWNGWGLVLSDNDGDGVFSGTLPGLNDGEYEYIIFCSGQEDNWSGWGVTINAPIGAQCDWDPNDEWPNYGFDILGSDIYQSYCAGSCDDNCGDIPEEAYTLVWSDEFNGETIDESKWNFEIGNGNWGWGNGEHQYYREENASIENGKLVIEARNENYGGFDYTSARMQTRNKGDWLYGKITASIKVPNAGGTWPAFWMMPTNSVYGGWPHSGEIDIMEHYGCDSGDVHATVHNTTFNWNGGTPPTSYSTYTNATSEFHEYTVEWSENELKFSVDGNPIGSYYNENSGSEQWPYDKEFYVILNLAIGSHFMPCNTENNLFPQRYEVDYVRVYQLSNQPSFDFGDTNQDNSVDVLDIVLIISYILGDDELSSNQQIISDINQDGTVDIIDVVIIVSNII